MAEKEYIERGKLLRKAMYICKTYGIPKITTERLKKAMADSTAADVVEVRQIEKAKQEILARIDEFIAEYRGISQSYVDYFGGKAEAMEVARRLVNASLIDLCDSCDAKMDGIRKEQK